MARAPTLDEPRTPTFQERKPVRGSLVWWLRFLGLVAFVILLLIQLPRSQEVHLARIDLRWLGFCMLLTGVQLLLEAFVWQWLLGMQRIRHPYPKTLVAYLASQYLGLVTPGHVGEFLAAGYISMNTGITFGYALSSVVMKKALFWITTISFGIWGLPLLAEVPFFQGVGKIVWASGIILAVLLAGITIWVVSLRRLARKWEKLSPWKVEMTEWWAGFRHLVRGSLVIPLALAALAFSILFLQLDAVLHAIGLSVPFLFVCQLMALSRIAARLIPVSFVGFGTKDAAIILLLLRHHVELPVAIAVPILFLLCTYPVMLLLSGICWWIKPLVVRRAAASTA